MFYDTKIRIFRKDELFSKYYCAICLIIPKVFGIFAHGICFILKNYNYEILNRRKTCYRWSWWYDRF